MNQISEFISHHWQLWCLAIVLGIAILINEWYSQKKRAKELSPQAAVTLINSDEPLTIIDIRDKAVYKQGHIIEAIAKSPEDFSASSASKYKDKQLLLVCARGIQSQALAIKLRLLGLNPIVLAGGMAAWQAANLPLVKSKN